MAESFRGANDMTKHTTPLPARVKNEIGNRYGRLLVIEQAPAPEHYKEKRQGFWLCRCDCGNIVVANAALLRRGMKMSCGCYNRDYHRVNIKHGMAGSSEYGIWAKIKSRCTNPKHSHYRYYGGRGITMCDRWRDSFDAFCQDVGPRPSPTHTIDRIDVNGNYEPGNVRWATRKQQANNRRNTVRLTYQGKTQLLAEWADELGIPLTTILNRYYRIGGSTEDVLFVGNLKRRR
jgi:hypothetical protein